MKLGREKSEVKLVRASAQKCPAAVTSAIEIRLLFCLNPGNRQAKVYNMKR